MEQQHQRLFICDESSRFSITEALNNRNKIPLLSRTVRTMTICEKQSILSYKIYSKNNHLSVQVQIDAKNLSMVKNFSNIPEGRKSSTFDPYKNLSVVVAMSKLCKLLKANGVITVDCMVSFFLGYRFAFMKLFEKQISGFLLPEELLEYECGKCISGTNYYRQTLTFITSQLNINIIPLPATLTLGGDSKNYYQRFAV
jgi:hypothetical protein